MDHVIAQLTASAKRLGIEQDSPAFADALELATLAFEDGRDASMAIEFGRSVLCKASTSERSARVLTAA